MAELSVIKDIVNCDLSNENKVVLLKMFSNVKLEVDVKESPLDQIKNEKNFKYTRSGDYPNYLANFEYEITVNNETFKVCFETMDRTRSKLLVQLRKNGYSIVTKKYLKLKLDNKYYDSRPGQDACEFKWKMHYLDFDNYGDMEITEKIIDEAFDKYKDVMFTPFMNNNETIQNIQQLLNNLK